MKKTTLSGLISFILMLTLAISSCGGRNGTANTPAPTQAIVKIATTGTPSAVPIGIVQAQLNLPSGVSVKATQNLTTSGVVMASGKAAAATGTLMETGVYASGSVTVTIANTSGFGVGEFVTVACDISAGTSVIADDFSVTNLDARDLYGNVISGLTPTFTVTTD